MKTVGQRIKYLREQAGLSQLAFASTIGISRSYVSETEADKHIPGKNTLYRIAKQLDIDLDWLITGEGETKPIRTKIQSASFELGVPQKLLVSLVNAYKGGEKEKYEFVKEFIKTKARSKAENVIS